MFYYYLPHCRINIKLHLFTREQGGRENGIVNDYRVDHALSEDGVLTMGMIYFLEKERQSINTGETAEVQVVFLLPDNSKSKILELKKGDKWKIFEGRRCVGECEMIEIVTNFSLNS